MTTQSFPGKIGIIGSGALGAFYGAKLFRGGYDVHFLMRSDYETVKQNGLKVKSIDGDFEIRPPVYNSADAMGICDLVIIGLKTTSNESLATLLPPVAGAHTAVLTLQNGLGNEEEIAKVLRPKNAHAESQIMGGIAFLCSNRTAPGCINHIDHGWIRMAELAGMPQARTKAVAEMFEKSGVRCEVYDSLMKARWEKLVWNIPFNGLGVAAESNTEQVLNDEELNQVARGLMQETMAIAAATGTPLSPDMADKMMHNTASMGPYHSSMQVDHEQGRPLEVESIIGEPLRRGKQAGASTPRLQMLYALVRKRNKAA